MLLLQKPEILLGCELGGTSKVRCHGYGSPKHLPGRASMTISSTSRWAEQETAVERRIADVARQGRRAIPRDGIRVENVS